LILYSWHPVQYEGMNAPTRNRLLTGALCSWNWKCALMSATARSIVCLAAMAHTGLRSGVAATLVELAYVTLTAGAYAGMQQRALALRGRALGNLIVVAGVPGLAQALDWLVHRASGAPVSGGALTAMSVFTVLSALFHLHVMRNGVFLSGHGRSLLDDFRRIPVLVAGFVMRPFALFATLARGRVLKSKTAVSFGRATTPPIAY
jgi:hypothetical protein